MRTRAGLLHQLERLLQYGDALVVDVSQDAREAAIVRDRCPREALSVAQLPRHLRGLQQRFAEVPVAELPLRVADTD